MSLEPPSKIAKEIGSCKILLVSVVPWIVWANSRVRIVLMYIAAFKSIVPCTTLSCDSTVRLAARPVSVMLYPDGENNGAVVFLNVIVEGLRFRLMMEDWSVEIGYVCFIYIVVFLSRALFLSLKLGV